MFTWGEGRRGQLGHGEVESWRSRPHCVEALKEKSITRVAAGDGFSVFTSDNGIVMTCGDGSFGALGHGDWHSSASPKLVEDLLDKDIESVSCGNEHVVVVTGRGEVYAWGRGADGRLGLGSEEDHCSPQKVSINTDELYIVSCRASGNGTMLISDQGQIYSSGGNRYVLLMYQTIQYTELPSQGKLNFLRRRLFIPGTTGSAWTTPAACS